MRGAIASSSLSLFEGSPNSQQWPGLPFIRGWHFLHIVAWVKCQSFTNWASPNWAAQHDESGRVARYHLTWLEWYVVLRLSWQSTRFQNPRQKAGNDGPLFFWSPFSSTAEMVKLMIWVQVPDFWNIRRTDWQGASSSQNVHFLVIILYYIIYIYIYYIYILYILYITTFLAGGDHTYHITFPSRSVNQIPSPDRPRYPSSTSWIPNDRAFIEASVHRDLLSRGRGPPKNNTDTLR